MKGLSLVIIGVVAAALVIGGVFAAVYLTTYNNLVGLEAAVDAQWADVEAQLQRRYDLIPNVVSAARQYIAYEGSILENITRLRSQWAAAEQTGNVGEINNATGQLEAELPRFIIAVEAYPDLKASEVVEDLIVELEGTENRIAVERMRYNDAARDFNVAIKAFPGNLFAGGWGFEQKAYFQAKVGADEPPSISP
ncbi:MAG TPA: LemA family protein [Candidatus Bathyarchaeia archaeon]|nr:LemA family protein [Candidatus Bathyarchaeia archaeon]